MEFKHHRYTKEDALNLVLILGEGEKSSKELYQALEEKGLYQETESDSARCQRISSFKKFARTVLGEGAIQEIKKPLTRTTRTGRGGCRNMRYFSLTISPEEARKRIGEYKPTHSGGRRKNSPEETKEQEMQVSTPNPLHIRKTALLEMTKEITNFFENTQDYSPRQFKDLLEKVSTSGFSSQGLIEVVISSFEEAELRKIEEIKERYLA